MTDTTKALTSKQVRTFLREEIANWTYGYTNHIGPDKGRIANVKALRAIRHLRAAIKMIPAASHQKRTRR